MKLDRHLFEWPSRHHVHLALPLMLLLSFALHAACVFVFQVAYPRSHASRERPAQVYFLAPGSPVAARIEPLLAAEDPALFSPGQTFGRDAWKLPETSYVASFDSEAPSLAPLPPETATVQPAAAGPVTSGAPERNAAKKPGPGLPTALLLGGSLAGREVTPPEKFVFSAPPRQGLSAAEFLIAVSPDGRPLHLLPQRSSGNEAVDQAALRYLAGCRFSADASSPHPAWGTATFLWGTDVRRDETP